MSESSRDRAYLALSVGPRWIGRDITARVAPPSADGEAAVSQSPVRTDGLARPEPRPSQSLADSPQPQAAPEFDLPMSAAVKDRAQQRKIVPVEPLDAGSTPADVGTLDWEALRRRVADCRACGLCETRTQTVFGVGAQQARWMLIGEAPGAEEDQRGEPFVGKAGRLLDSMLAAIGLSRERDVFIANVLKCRPPRNRDPQPEEVRRCEPFLLRQIELVAPDIVLLFGRFAAQTLLATDASIASLRGRRHTLTVGGRELPAIVTYHPAYLLRTPQDKAKSWRDLVMARRLAAERDGTNAG